MMLVTFGKHKGKSLETLVIKEPDYIKWVLDQYAAEGPLAKLREEAVRLTSIFDNKPILRQCLGHQCTKRSVRFTAYTGVWSPLYYWCAKCDPYEQGALKGKLTVLTRYREALQHVEFSCYGDKAGYKAIIRDIALAKGLPQRSGESQVESFFHKAIGHGT